MDNKSQKKEKCNSSNEQYNDNTCTRDKGDKNFQAEKCVHMWPVKLKKDVQSEKPAMKPSNKESIGLNKNGKYTVSHNKQKK